MFCCASPLFGWLPSCIFEGSPTKKARLCDLHRRAFFFTFPFLSCISRSQLLIFRFIFYNTLMETLGKMFGSPARVKIMKLFLSNDSLILENGEISKRTKVGTSVLKKELALLNKIGFITKKNFIKEIEVKVKKPKKGEAPKVIKKKIDGWGLNDKFPYIIPLHSLLVGMTSFTSSSVLKKISGAGKMKLIIVAGVFLQNSDSRLDILIVGDKIKQNTLNKAIGHLESEVGKELRYVVFDTEEFNYRMNVFDKLIRDVLDFPHQKIVNRLGI